MTDKRENLLRRARGPAVGLALVLGLVLSSATAMAQSDAEIVEQLGKASRLFSAKQYEEAARLYLSLSSVGNESQAAWALELYGVCLEKQLKVEEAVSVYQQWLQQYAGTAGEARVQQRLLALQTATQEPRSRMTSKRSNSDPVVYGSASLMYRGLTRKVEDQDRETPISSIAADTDLHFQADGISWSWSGRASGGYLSDHADDGESDGRVSNLYLGLTHARSGVELLVGRRRSSDSGIYGYLDGASLSVPVGRNLTLMLQGGGLSASSRSSSDSDRLVYALSAEYQVPDSALRFEFYFMNQDYDGLTERRAVGSEMSFFSDSTSHFLVLDYDTEFEELNNAMYNGSWQIAEPTNLSLSLGYQRSPFLSAGNAIIGEYDTDLARFLERLDKDNDIYDEALDKTALSQYGSLVLNHELYNGHRIIGEVYYFDLSELPQYEFSPEAPDSEANTTLGLQYVWPSALFDNDTLSMGIRYNTGDMSDSEGVYVDEKLYLDHDLNLIVRLRADRRTVDDYDQEAITVRPGIRLDWYFTRDLLLETELGYEWLMQDFGSEDFEVQQGFLVMGLRKRF